MSGSTRDYRGAVVEDLQLPPAFCLHHSAPLFEALEAAFERDFDQLPVLGDNRKPIGYLDVPVIKRKFEAGQLKDDETIRSHTTFFRARPPAPSSSTTQSPESSSASKESTPVPASPTNYKTIHPMTPLEDLDAFLVDHEFALVTDEQRKWVLAVATRSDLETFAQRRGAY